jgi:hypothetical protein
VSSFGADTDAPFPFWAYVDQIPTEDFQGYDCSEGSAQWVWRSSDALKVRHEAGSRHNSKPMAAVAG